MDTFDMLEVCDKYARLGGAVQDQLRTVLEYLGRLDDAFEAGELNMNAVARIHEFLTDVSALVDDDDTSECADAVEYLNEYAKENGIKFSYGSVRSLDGPRRPRRPCRTRGHGHRDALFGFGGAAEAIEIAEDVENAKQLIVFSLVMATVTDRLRRPTLLPGIIAGLLFCLLCAGSAAHAATLQRHHDGVQRARSHGNAQAQAGTLAQTTGLTASQVTAAAVCPAARPGHARCAADALVLRSDRRLVRPRVRGRASFTQVFPRVAHGIVPEAATANSIGAAAPQAGTPAYLQQAYDLGYLSQTAGTGDTVAIVDAYDDPGAASDLATYRSTFGLPACTTANGCFTKVNEHGATSPLPAGNTEWEMEESLDMDAVSSLCPNCHILLVEANSASFSDLDTAVITAAAMGAKQISNSWAGGAVGPIGGSFSFPGVAVIAATGDGGYDGPGWDAYPAALPGVTAAGGTTLTASGSSAARARGFTESAWSLSGGEGGGSGCDVYEAKPSYQTDNGCNGRSYSDVSADANPSTGMIVYDAGNGGWLQVGGTSLATPLIAAFDAVTGVSGGAAQWAYSDAALLNDPATGSNGSCATQIAYICNAGTGYDGPTGAGSISGDIVTGAPGIGGPSVGTGSGNTYTQSVTTTAATLAGGVYPNGLATTYWWQYGTTTGYGQQTPAVSIGSGRTAVAVTSALSGLIANTTYHYRLVAQNSDGTSYGYDSTLATKASAPVNSAAPVISGTAREGQMLSATAGSWSAAGTLTYQWRRSVNGGSTWTAVTGAVTMVDNLGVADAGALIDVVVTDTTSSGATSATSAAAGPVQSDAPVATAVPNEGTWASRCAIGVSADREGLRSRQSRQPPRLASASWSDLHCLIAIARSSSASTGNAIPR